VKKTLAISFTSTFAIFPELAHNPIAKELVKPARFCLSGNLLFLKTKTILYYVVNCY